MPVSQSDALRQLKSFLNKLFQFESQDLDFGIYKILHFKRREINDFIERLLTEEVQRQLDVFDLHRKSELEAQLAHYEGQKAVRDYLTSLAEDPDEAKVLYKFNRDEIDWFLHLRKELNTARLLENAEETVYNHLTLFFSRYYDKGDFISKRRFGKSAKYVVPYNGEETHFHWANHDQYYIKSGEYFQKFSFRIPHSSGNLAVHFKLTQAHTEQGNVKAEESKFFVLSEKTPELQGEELSIFFEFRPLTEAEKTALPNNGKQDQLDERAAEKLKTLLAKEPLAARLWEQDEDGASLLLRKLHHYTRKNSYDFFIHKDLKTFLQRELDFYVKSELVRVDDLYVLESDVHFENIRHQFKLIRCFKNIADTLIEFLAQIEDFQKKLWEKKKFVLDTQWIVTLDKLAAWLPEDAFRSFANEALQNPAQVQEWKNLFGEDLLPKRTNRSLDDLRHDLLSWRKLPLDTVHFSEDFKMRLLSALSEHVNLEEEADGLVLHSDNFHGLTLMQEKFRERVKCVYIDPPYNTTENGFIYKNNYQHSSWIASIERLLEGTIAMLLPEGVFNCTIDDFEFSNLDVLLQEKFGKERQLGRLIIEIKPSGRTNDKYFSTSHEYCISYAKDINKADIAFFPLKEEIKAKYSEGEGEEAYKWRDFLRTGGFSTPAERPNSYYSIYFNSTTQDAKLEPFEGAIEIKPVDSEGKDRVWRKTPTSFLEHLEKGEIKFALNNQGKWKVQIIDKIKSGIRPKSVWVGKSYDAASHGTKLLKKLFNTKEFSFPKSLFSTKDVIFTVSGDEDSGYILDYFPGSGTTFHATQLLNREDEGKRKCLLIEQGGYVHTVILPRIKKIAYTFDWKEGKPKDGSMNGLGVLLKYQRLEQYEESLENIAFTPQPPEGGADGGAQQALAFEQYLPKYFLHFETKGSAVLVNPDAMQDPWGYRLKTWDGFTYDTERAADLVETFNYLLGLHVQKYLDRQHEGRRYVIVWGWNNEGQKSLVVWRNVTGWQERDFAADQAYVESLLPQFEHERLYVNGQCTVKGSQMIEDIFKSQMIPR